MKNQSPDIFISKEACISYTKEEALALILNNLEDTFFLVGKDLKVITTNQYTKQKTKEYLNIVVGQGTCILDLAPLNRRPALIKLYRETFKGATTKTETEMIVEGSLKYFQHQFKPAVNESGEIVGAFVVTRDITETKKAEINLIGIEERWRFALEGSNHGLWDWNIETGYCFFSNSYKNLYGFDSDEIPNHIKEWEIRVHPDDRLKVDKAVADHFSSTNPYYECIYRMKDKNDSYHWVLARGLLVSRTDEGKPLRMIGTHTDISKQISAEEELKRINERWTYAAMASSEALWEWNIITGEVFMSRVYTDILGWRVDKQRKFNEWHDYIHPDDRRETIDEYYAAIQNPSAQYWAKEYRYLKIDGTYATVFDKAIILRDEDGKATKVIGATQDITERKQNENILLLERQIFELSTNLEVPFQKIVEKLLQGIEIIYPDAFTSVVLAKGDGTIEPFFSPSLPKQFLDVLNGLKIGPYESFFSASMYKKQPVIVSNIDTDELWRDNNLPGKKFGFKACFAFPIIHSAGNVMGTFAIQYKRPKSPTKNEINAFDRICNMLRILMEHNWSLNEIKIVNERFDIMMKATHDLIWDWDLESNKIYRDARGLKKVYGVDNNEAINNTNLWLKRVHPEDRSKAKKIISEILLHPRQDKFDMEYRFQKDDGSYSHVYDRGMIIRNAEGKPIRMIGAAQDVTERKNLEQELLLNELERQKAINKATVDTQEKERSEIGKELHDNVNQVLTTTKLYLDLAAGSPELKDELIKKSSKNIISVINEIRQLSRSLMDPSIDDLGLIDSTNDLIESINLTGKLFVNLSADKKIDTLLTKNHKLTIFRIMQETLNNAIKHSGATTVSINFKIEKNVAVISIEDNGIGFQPALVKKGAGLKNIQNRIYLINGTHTMQTSPGEGCKIILKFPVNS